MIRPAEIRDVPALLKLLDQVHDAHAKVRPDVFRLGKRKYQEEDLLTVLADDSQLVFVFEQDGQVAGHLFALIKEVTDHASLQDRKILFIDDLCVDSAHRGQKIGEQLYQFAKEFATNEGCQAVTLDVWEDNAAALRFYQRLGMTSLKRVMEDKL